MAMSDAVDNLAENRPSFLLSQSSVTLDKLQKITTRSIFKDHIHVLLRLKDFKQSYDVFVSNSGHQRHFAPDFLYLSRLQISLINHLDRHWLPSQPLCC